MTTTTHYYVLPDSDPVITFEDVKSFMVGAFTQVITGPLKIDGEAVINITWASINTISTGMVAESDAVEFGYTDDGSEIQIGDTTWPLDLLVDTALQVAATTAIMTALGISAALSIPAILIAGAVSVAYSKFVDPITEDVINTLAGKDMVQFFDTEGLLDKEVAGIVFGDGIPAQNGVAELDAAWAFITNENSAQFNLVGGYVKVDTNLLVDKKYYIYDGEIFDQIATAAEVSLIELRTTDNGSLTNDAYYAEAGHGNYIFFEENNVQIGVPVTIGGQQEVILVDNVFENTAHYNNLIIGDIIAVFEKNLILGGSGAVTGGDNEDVLLGGAGANLLNGGDDDDIVLGGSGNDTIEGSEDDDTIDGGDGIDLLDYSVFDSYLDNDVKVDLVLSNSTVYYLFDNDHQEVHNIENVRTGNGDDTVDGNAVANEIETGNGNDLVHAGGGDDTIDAGEGNNTVRGAAGADSIVAGGGNDWLHANALSGSIDNDADYINGGGGNDIIYGTGGGDTLIGGAGDDYIVSQGDATLMGGSGLDYYTAKAGDVIIDADGGRFNGASFVQYGEHIWHAGTTIHPFKVFGNTLYVYTDGLQTATSSNYFTIQNFVNDGRWGFTIAQQYYDAKNEFVIDVAGDESPDENVNPEDSGTPLSNPTTGHPNENPSPTNPTLNSDDTNQNEHGYLNHTSYLQATIGFDTQNGGTADDTYEWGSGFHDDLIIDAGGSGDSIKMLNLNESDVSIEQSGDDIVVRALTSANLEELTIEGHYLATGAVESIEFADGSTLSLGFSSSGHTNAIEHIENADDSATENIVALGGADTIMAWDGNDTIDGGAGDDSIVGRYGDKVIDGGAGNDVIRFVESVSSNNDIQGGSGDDSIFASRGLDTLAGGTGNDTLEGYLGDDVYIWGVGDGNDLLKESHFSGGGNDTLKLIGGITLADLDIFGSSNYDVKLVYIPTGEEITMYNYFYDTDREIETLTFDDGSTHALSTGHVWRGDEGDDDLRAAGYDDVMYGYAGNDTIDAWHGNDTIYGGTGDDFLKGHYGDDVYMWAAGDGNDVIEESRFTSISGTDMLRMTGGITAADLEIYGIAGGSVMVTYVPTSETVTINYQFVDTDYRVETIEFDDGSSFDLVSSITNWYGTSGNDNLTGSSNDETYKAEAGNDSVRGGSGNDTIEGGSGNDTLKGENGDDFLTGGLDADTLWGGSGNDTYFWASGDGNDEIAETSGSDTLKMTGGITASDLTFTGVTGQDLLITYTPTGEELTINLHHYHSYQDYRIETIEFDDGSTYSLLEGVEWTGTTGNDVLKAGKYDDTVTGDAGNDTLYGYAGNDSLTGGAGNDTLYGYDGDDTYIWQSGNGNDVIAESWNVVGGNDTLLMTGGITASDVTFSLNGSNHLVINHTPTGETVQINYQNHYDSDYHVETLAFDDGSTINLKGDIVLTLDGTSGNDSIKSSTYDEVLNGYAGNDTLWSMAGEDTLIGGTGDDNLWGSADADTYIWASGDGNDIIWETYNVVGGDDTLLMTGGIVAADVTFADSGNHLLITHTPTGEVITINYQNHSDPDYHVETLLFDDGSTVDLLGV